MLTYPIKWAREVRTFPVAVVLQRLRNIQISLMYLKRCCCCCFFANLNLLFFCCSPSPLQKLPIVVIQKFCYHGNVTSHFSSLLDQGIKRAVKRGMNDHRLTPSSSCHLIELHTFLSCKENEKGINCLNVLLYILSLLPQ